ncbi:putative permease [Candidatus Izimaplasma bacterium HR1]|uniref:permease n=1 Tax=Candidatus Izimoplasma sp. HR1 TaxID=1541959 RepID=UPI0004F79D8D|nr:putative permease [Candidatus Izimaplasma bacterium HR1]
MNIFNKFNDIFLKMTWLYDLIEKLVVNVFGLNMATRVGNSVHFFIYDVIKIFILLCFLIFLISYIQSFFPPERTQKILSKYRGIKGNIIGALLGTITPFCSCSSIPIFIGFTKAGLPLGITFSFLISSPLVDLASFLILMSFFGIEFALAYVIVGLFLAVIGGTIIDKSKMEDYVQDYIKDIKKNNQSKSVEISFEMSLKERLEYSYEQVKEIIGRVWLYIFIGVGIGAAIHNYIPESLIGAILGENNPFNVFIAAIVGIPMYADIFGTIPIAEALLGKGVGTGTVLAFMMAVTALSLPSMVMLSKVVKPKLLTMFIVIVSVGIIIIGYLFNFLHFLFV